MNGLRNSNSLQGPLDRSPYVLRFDMYILRCYLTFYLPLGLGPARPSDPGDRVRVRRRGEEAGNDIEGAGELK